MILFVDSTIAVDDFTGRLFRIHQQILKEGRSQVCVFQVVITDNSICYISISGLFRFYQLFRRHV